MTASSPTQAEIARAPEGVREALLKLVELGMMVAEMLGGVAQVEKAQNDAAAEGRAAGKVTGQPATYAEAIEMDQATTAAFEARLPMASRSEIVGSAGRGAGSQRPAIDLCGRECRRRTFDPGRGGGRICRRPAGPSVN